MLQPILFFDGNCSLCNKTVRFIINHEARTTEPILFCSLQSAYAKQALEKYQYNFNQLNSLVLLIDEAVFYTSDAVLKICNYLKAPYKWFVIFKIVPAFIRDGIYNYIAKNRHQLSKTPFCYKPSPALKNRFLE
ncbi:MAG TPA: DUF393 domain-containing protein [Bacteroidia bacterium]